MIKIHYTNNKLNSFAENHVNNCQKERDEIEIKINKFLILKGKKDYRSIYRYIKCNLDSILEGNLSQLEEHIFQIEKMILAIAGKKNSHTNWKNFGINLNTDSWKGWRLGMIIDNPVSNLIKSLEEYASLVKSNSGIIIKLKECLTNFKNSNDIDEFEKRFGEIRNLKSFSKVKSKFDKDLSIISHFFKLKKESNSLIKKAFFVKTGEKEKALFAYNGSDDWVLKMLKDLNINTCLYCNRQYISVSGNKKFGTTMDHFYDKATYPYLALSFYNLIPSCYSCNSQMKNTKDFSLSTHLHPYEKGFEEILHFKTDIDKLEDILDKNNSDFRIVLDEYNKVKPDKYDLLRAKRNVEDFLLEDQYQIHQKEVKDLLDLGLKYISGSKIFFKDWEELFSDKDEAIRIMFNGVLTNKENLHERTLSKLKRDIAIEYFGDIFNL